ncbi:MAG: hypothetical protein ACK5Z2_17625 [Bacteroidota bacterium]
MKASQHNEPVPPRAAAHEQRGGVSLPSPGEGVVQRFAYAGARQIIAAPNAIEGRETYPAANLSAHQQAVIDDGYNRYYRDRNEFERHTTGLPVQVGLVKNLGLWYRLPFGHEFFVLGENHSVLNYRTIMAESHRTENIMGEGGTVPIDYYQPAAADRAALDSRALANGQQEFPMESTLSKTYFSLTAATQQYQQQLAAPAAAAPAAAAADPNHLQFDAWTAGLGNKAVERNDKKIPSYMGNDGQRKYLAPEAAAPEANYSVLTTAIGIIRNCKAAIEEFNLNNIVALHEEPDAFTTSLINLRKSLDAILNLLPQGAETVLTAGQKTNLANVLLPAATARCQASAQAEINRSSITSVDEVNNAEATQAMLAQQHNHGLLAAPCTMRDVFMFEGIKQAYANDYLMAGVGDNHAKHLAAALHAEGIRVIRYNQFFSNAHTINAFGAPTPNAAPAPEG